MATAMHGTRRMRLPDDPHRQALLRLLGEQDGVLHTRKEALRRNISGEMLCVTDEQEHSLDAEELGVGASVLALTSRTVQGIETALRRVEAGEYGTCSECSGRISRARLRALPSADLCRGCQEMRDMAGLSMKRHPSTHQGWR